MTHHRACALVRLLSMGCFVAALGGLAPPVVHAQTVVHNVASSADFVAAIAAINGDPTSDHRIEITAGFTMLEQVQAIEIAGSLEVVGVGANRTIDGGGSFRPFFITEGEVSLENLTLANGSAKGGDGGNGAGGGLGAGAAVFVSAYGELRLKNVHFANNIATGGQGGAMGSGAGGGGGLGGNGGNAGNGGTGAGGGGGLYGQGGSSSGDAGGGGGGGPLQDGGGSSTPDGGGGGGTLTPGTDSASGGSGGDGGRQRWSFGERRRRDDWRRGRRQRRGERGRRWFG